MRVTLPAMVLFRYPLLVDWVHIYVRHYEKRPEQGLTTYYLSRMSGAIVLEIPDLPLQLVQSLEEVGCYVER